MPESAGWLPDPNGRHEQRYWDGAQWTDHVADHGATSTDRYDPAGTPPPPPTGGGTASATGYRIVYFDRRGNEIYAAPFRSPDAAMEHADRNQQFDLGRSVGRALLHGVGSSRKVVAWRTATIFAIDGSGRETEYHTLRQG